MTNYEKFLELWASNPGELQKYFNEEQTLKQRQIEALEKSVIHWTEIVEICTENTAKGKEDHTCDIKLKALVRSVSDGKLKSHYQPLFLCFLCDSFFENTEQEEPCPDCPVKWTGSDEVKACVARCEQPPSPYLKYSENNSPMEDLQAAIEVLQLLEDTLEKLRQ